MLSGMSRGFAGRAIGKFRPNSDLMTEFQTETLPGIDFIFLKNEICAMVFSREILSIRIDRGRVHRHFTPRKRCRRTAERSRTRGARVDERGRDKVGNAAERRR